MGFATLSGRFWLAGARGVVVPGELTLGAEGPRLQWDGALTPAMKIEKVETAGDGSTLTTLVPTAWEDVSSRLTIHGEVASGVASEPVTVVDACIIGRDFNGIGFEVGPGSGRQQLQARYAVCGGHLSGADEQFTGVRTRLRHLEPWANLGGFNRSLAADQASITFQRPDVPPAQLANGGLLSLDQDLSWSRDGDSEELTRTTWLRVDQLPAVWWRELDRGVVTPLTTLLTLAVGADCSAVEVEVSTGNDTRWMSLHSSGLRPPAEQPQLIQDMLLPLHTLGLAGVAAWLDRAEALGPLPPVVAAIAASPLPNMETAVLELATVAEGLARRLWPDWKRLTDQAASLVRHSAVDAVKQQGAEVISAVVAALAQVHEPSFPQRLLKLAERADRPCPEW